MTRLNLELNGPDRAVNVAQGSPDFKTDARNLDAAAKARARPVRLARRSAS